MNVTIRRATIADMSDINDLVESAVMTWKLSERVKRLSLPGYRYHEQDFLHMKLFVAEDEAEKIVGIYALDDTDMLDYEKCQSACLLHGIYVLPDCQRQGVGKALFKDAEDHVRQSGGCHLLVKAQPGAIGFFRAQGMMEVQGKNNSKEYPYYFHKKVVGHGK